MPKFSNINAAFPVIDADKATESELILYLGLNGVKVVSPAPESFRMLYKSKQVALKATLFMQALKEACSTFSKI